MSKGLFKSIKETPIERFFILILILSSTMTLTFAQPITFIVVKNARGEIVTYLVSIFAEGCTIERLNVTHVAILIFNKTKMLIFKDGIVVYEAELTSPSKQQVIEVIARLQHVTIRLPYLRPDLVIIRYGNVILSKYVEDGVIQLTNVPYPVNLTLEIPRAKYKVTLTYMGEEIIEVKSRKFNYNTYLRFYDVFSKPLPIELIEISGAKVIKINKTCAGLSLSKELKLEVLRYGIKIAEIKVNPPVNQVKVINVKLPIGPLKVVAPKNSTITVLLPSGVMLSKHCMTGEVVFEHIPACKLRVIATKDQLKYEKVIEFPGTLTVSVFFKESKPGIINSSLDLILIIPVLIVSITLIVIVLRSKREMRGLYKRKDIFNKHRKSITRISEPKTRKVSKRIVQKPKGVYLKSKISKKREEKDKVRSLGLVDLKANDLADLINKLKKYRKELEKMKE